MALLIAICTCTPARAQSWVAAPAFPDHTQGREFAIGMLYQGKLLAVGGTPWMNGQDMDGAVHYVDPPYVGSWQEATPLAGMGPVIHQGGGIDGLGRIIIFGGVNIDNGDPGENVVYDLIEGPKGKIAARGALAPDDNFAYCTDAQNRLYSIGGGPGRDATPGNPNSTYVERYDGTSDTWQALAPLNVGRAGAAAVYDGRGHVLSLGGYGPDGSNRMIEVSQYDVIGNVWSDSALSDLPVVLSDLRAVLGADGRVYALGGEAGSLPSGVVQIGVHAQSDPTACAARFPDCDIASAESNPDGSLNLGDIEAFIALLGVGMEPRNNADRHDALEARRMHRDAENPHPGTPRARVPYGQ